MSTYFFNLVQFSFVLVLVLVEAELWEKDVSSEMKIGLSTTGYKSVDLRCDADHFSVNVTLEKDFEGVVYTRGSFDDKKSPCFKNYRQNSGKEGRNLIMSFRIPYEKCRTVMDVAESRHTNTLVVQHDPDLIMPGDAAFSLECAFTPEFKVNVEMATEQPYKSKIKLVDADPSGKKSSDRENPMVFSKSERVTFHPRVVQRKEEL